MASKALPAHWGVYARDAVLEKVRQAYAGFTDAASQQMLQSALADANSMFQRVWDGALAKYSSPQSYYVSMVSSYGYAQQLQKWQVPGLAPSQWVQDAFNGLTIMQKTDLVGANAKWLAYLTAQQTYQQDTVKAEIAQYKATETADVTLRNTVNANGSAKGVAMANASLDAQHDAYTPIVTGEQAALDTAKAADVSAIGAFETIANSAAEQMAQWIRDARQNYLTTVSNAGNQLSAAAVAAYEAMLMGDQVGSASQVQSAVSLYAHGLSEGVEIGVAGDEQWDLQGAEFGIAADADVVAQIAEEKQRQASSAQLNRTATESHNNQSKQDISTALDQVQTTLVAQFPASTSIVDMLMNATGIKSAYDLVIGGIADKVAEINASAVSGFPTYSGSGGDVSTAIESHGKALALGNLLEIGMAANTPASGSTAESEAEAKIAASVQQYQAAATAAVAAPAPTVPPSSPSSTPSVGYFVGPLSVYTPIVWPKAADETILDWPAEVLTLRTKQTLLIQRQKEYLAAMIAAVRDPKDADLAQDVIEKIQNLSNAQYNRAQAYLAVLALAADEADDVVTDYTVISAVLRIAPHMEGMTKEQLEKLKTLSNDIADGLGTKATVLNVAHRSAQVLHAAAVVATAALSGGLAGAATGVAAKIAISAIGIGTIYSAYGREALANQGVPEEVLIGLDIGIAAASMAELAAAVAAPLLLRQVAAEGTGVVGQTVRQVGAGVEAAELNAAKQELNQLAKAEGQAVRELPSEVAADLAAAERAPGTFGRVSEAMSGRAARYQSQITGRLPEVGYQVGGVKFDGFTGRILLDAKGPGYAKFVKDGIFASWWRGKDSLVAQARRQLQVANGVPIQWHFAEEKALEATRTLFRQNGIEGIEFVLSPAH